MKKHAETPIPKKGTKREVIVTQVQSREPIVAYLQTTRFVNIWQPQGEITGGTKITEPHRVRFVNDKHGGRARDKTFGTEIYRRQQEMVRNHLEGRSGKDV